MVSLRGQCKMYNVAQCPRICRRDKLAGERSKGISSLDVLSENRKLNALACPHFSGLAVIRQVRLDERKRSAPPITIFGGASVCEVPELPTRHQRKDGRG